MRMGLALCALLAALPARAEPAAPSAYVRLRDSDDDVRAAAAAELARDPQRGPRARAALTDALDDPSDRVRLTAAKALATYAEPGVLDALERLMKSEPSYEFRRDLAVALSTEPAHRKDPETTALLTWVLSDDPDALVRRAVAESLGARGDADALVAEKHAAAYDPDKLVRRAASAAVQVLAVTPKALAKKIEAPAADALEHCHPPYGICRCDGVVARAPACLLKVECQSRYREFLGNAAFACTWDGYPL